MFTIQRSADRGKMNIGWLQARYSFSFSQYYDPQNVHFGMLRVFNDDIVAPGMGFSQHPHDNMEIITIPLSGSLKHKDTTGGNGVIESGEIQVMSAGSGVQHSEVNASRTVPLNLFQIWIFPNEKNAMPRYDQMRYNPEDTINNWKQLVGGEGEGVLHIRQDASIYMSQPEEGSTLNYKSRHAGDRGLFMMVIEGEVSIDGETLFKRDSVKVNRDSADLTLTATKESQLLLIDVPMR